MSYTTFGYFDLQMPTKVKAGEDVQLSVLVTNNGKLTEDEVVQLYCSDLQVSTLRLKCNMSDFKRISLKAGESKCVEFVLKVRQLLMINMATERVIWPGKFTVSVGGKQPGFKGQCNATTPEAASATFTVCGEFKFADF